MALKFQFQLAFHCEPVVPFTGAVDGCETGVGAAAKVVGMFVEDMAGGLG